MRHAVMVINRKGTRSHANLERGLRILEAAGIEVAAFFCRRPERVPEIIRRHGPTADLVIVGGGDGTLSQAAHAMVDFEKPLGILPMGNANDLARTLNIPVNIEAACSVIAGDRKRRIDLGVVNGRHFVNVASLGISVEIAEHLTADVKSRWGVAGYLRAASDVLHKAPRFDATISCDGREHRLDCLQIAVGNGRHYGGGMTVVEDAAIDDGRLDVYVLPPVRWWRLLILLPTLRSGKHRSVEDVTSLHGREIRVDTEPQMRINVDGEVNARTPAEFGVVPAALEVFAPPVAS